MWYRFAKSIVAYPVPDDFQPRTIREEDLPPEDDQWWEGRQRAYHATTAKDAVIGPEGTGLLSKRERRDFGVPGGLGLGGGDEGLVSFTSDRGTADMIASSIRDAKEIFSQPDPPSAFATAEKLGMKAAAAAGVDPDRMLQLAKAALTRSAISPESLELLRTRGMGYNRQWPDMIGWREEDLPEGAEPVLWREKTNGERVVTHYILPRSREDWGYYALKLYEQILEAIEQMTEKLTNPVFFGVTPQNMDAVDPSQIDVIEAILQGEPGRPTEPALKEIAIDPARTLSVVPRNL